MKVIKIKTPLPTPFGIITYIENKLKGVKYFLPDLTIAYITLHSDDENQIKIPVKLVPENSNYDAFFKFPPFVEEPKFFMKYSTFRHIQKCDMCFRYIIIHEFSHAVKKFIFPLPWELRGFGENTMYMVRDYFTDAIIDWWNIKHGNYHENDPIKSLGHRYGKSKVGFHITNRENLFEYLIYFLYLASHNTTVRKRLCDFMDSLPSKLYEEYAKLYDIMVNIDAMGEFSVFSVYKIIKNVAQLVLCKNKLDAVFREIKGAINTLYRIRTLWKECSGISKNRKKIMQEIYNKALIHPLQIHHVIHGEGLTNILYHYQNKDFNEVDDFLKGRSSNNSLRKTFLVDYQLSL